MADRDGTFAKNSVETLKKLHEFRKNNILCDAIVCTDDKEFHVHKVVLAASSPYFRALLTNGFKETQQCHIQLKTIQSKSFAYVLDYIYDKKIDIKSDIAMNIYPIADFLLISGLLDECTKLIENDLNLYNCLVIWRFAEFYSCLVLLSNVKRYILQRFKKFSQTDDFKQLRLDEVVSLIKSDELCIDKEDSVFRAVIQWTYCDVEKRKDYLYELLTNVRLSFCSVDFMKSVFDCELIKDNRNLETYIKTILDRTCSKSSQTRTRLPRDILFCVGGWSGGSPIPNFETYDPFADRWITQKHLHDSSPRAYHGMVVHEGKLYLIGGFNGSNFYNTVRVFDLVSRKWYEAAPMHHQRCYVATCILNNAIYACGGYDGRWRLQTAEKYDSFSNQWSLICPMIYRRSDAGSNTFKGKLFVVGGFDGEQCLNSAESYDPISNQWTLIPRLCENRSGVSLINFFDTLYALGGFNGAQRLSRCEKFNEQGQYWEEITSMKIARSNFAATVLNDSIYVIGGFDGHHTISIVEKFYPFENKWCEVSSMNINRSALKVCSVRDIPNLIYYSNLQCVVEKEDNTENKDADLVCESQHDLCSYLTDHSDSSGIDLENDEFDQE